VELLESIPLEGTRKKKLETSVTHPSTSAVFFFVAAQTQKSLSCATQKKKSNRILEDEMEEYKRGSGSHKSGSNCIGKEINFTKASNRVTKADIMRSLQVSSISSTSKIHHTKLMQYFLSICPSGRPARLFREIVGLCIK
jgi:hypothetical protein